MKLSFILLLLMPCFIFAQGENDKITYLDSLSKEAKTADYVYYRIVKDYQLAKDEYLVTDYYKSGKIKKEGLSTKKEYISKKGKWTSYYENGNMEKVSSFTNQSVELGAFTEWYEDGTKKTEGEFIKWNIDDKRDDHFKILQFWNTKGEQTIVDGNGNFEYEDKDGLSKGKINNGFKDGVWSGSNPKLGYTYVENYKDGVMISGESIDKDNVMHAYKTIRLKPDFKNGIKGFYTFVMKKFKTPKYEVTGRVVVGFMVEKDGSLSDIKILQSLIEPIDNEALRVMSICPAWIPGEERGIKVNCIYSLPISLKASN